MKAEQQNTFDIADIERSIMYVFCAEPDAAVHCDVEADDFGDLEVRTVIRAALEVHARGDRPTVEYIAAAGGGELADLRMHGRRATAQMRKDWGQSLRLVRLAAQKRRLLATFAEAQATLVKTPLLRLAEYNESLTARLAELMVTVSENPVELSALIEQVVEMPEKQVYDPMPTGVHGIDSSIGGGIRRQEVCTIVAPQKGGKTTTLRQILYTIAMSGLPVLHVAADGGNATRHALIYLGMHAASLCLRSSVPTLVEGYAEDALHWRNLGLWLNNQNPRNVEKELITPIVSKVEEQLRIARAELREMRTHGVINIVDPQTIGYDPHRAAAYIRKMYHHQGIAVVGVDHIGKFGEQGKHMGIFDRTGITVQAFTKLPGSIPIALVMLSQMNASGIKEVTGDGDHTDWSAGTEGGAQSQQESDHVIQVKRKGSIISTRAKLLRDGESHQPDWVDHDLHLGTGFFLPSRYKAVEGY